MDADVDEIEQVNRHRVCAWTLLEGLLRSVGGWPAHLRQCLAVDLPFPRHMRNECRLHIWNDCRRIFDVTFEGSFRSLGRLYQTPTRAESTARPTTWHAWIESLRPHVARVGNVVEVCQEGKRALGFVSPSSLSHSGSSPPIVKNAPPLCRPVKPPSSIPHASSHVLPRARGAVRGPQLPGDARERGGGVRRRGRARGGRVAADGARRQDRALGAYGTRQQVARVLCGPLTDRCCVCIFPRAIAQFIMIKPDGVNRGLVSEIIGRFEKRGYKLVGIRASSGCLSTLFLRLLV